MRKFAFLLSVLISPFAIAQDDIKTNGIFYKISLGTTLTINEEYELFDEYDDTFIIPSAFFINNTFGYQFDERTSIGLNAEYDWYSKQNIHFFPLHLSFRYNVLVNDSNTFIRAGYGRLIKLGNSFEKGTMYKVGIGTQMFDENYKNSILLGIDFSRKRFGFKQTEKLSSVSLFVEFMVF